MPGNSIKLLDMVRQALLDMKAVDLIHADVREMLTLTDYMVIASGRSGRHVRALADKLVETAKHNNCNPIGIEGYEHNEWILVDLGGVVIHIMQTAQREYYELEKLWLSDEQETGQETG